MCCRKKNQTIRTIVEGSMLFLNREEDGQQLSREWKDLQPSSAEVEVWTLGREDGEEKGETPMPTCPESLLPAGLAGKDRCQGILHPAGWM